jgi:hypothetical protein
METHYALQHALPWQSLQRCYCNSFDAANILHQHLAGQWGASLLLPHLSGSGY